MFVTLVAVVVALVLGHVAPAFVRAMRRYAWYEAWLQRLSVRFPDEASFWRGRHGIALALLPPLLLVASLQWLLHAPLLGLPGLLFGILVLVYTWGPRDLDVDVEVIIDAHDPDTRRHAIAALWPPGEVARSDGAGLVEAVFRNALRRWFGVVFWFLLLGPFGAMLYRLAALSSEGDYARWLPPRTLEGARRLRDLLEWPVAQLMTGSMALVGNFDTVFAAWRAAGGAIWQSSIAFLWQAARASVRGELQEEADDYASAGLVPVMGDLPELHDAMSLVWRILLLWLAVMALFVIAGWVS